MNTHPLLLLFRLGERHFAIPASDVAAVLPLPPLEAVSGAPPWLAGLFRYRGALLPLIDLKHIALGQSCAAAFSSRVILVEDRAGGTAGLLGLLAEGVTETRAYGVSQPLPEAVTQQRAEWLAPVVVDGVDGVVSMIRWQGLPLDQLHALLASAAANP